MNDTITKVQISEYLYVWITVVRGNEILVIESFGREIRMNLSECKILVDVLQAILKGKRPS